MVASAFLFQGCATLFKGSSEEVNFSSNPSGTEVWIDGKMMGKAPVNFKLITKKTYVIEFKHEGQTKTVNLNNHVPAGWIILDVLGYGFPVIIDAVTGAWYSFDQKNIFVDFKSAGVIEPSRFPSGAVLGQARPTGAQLVITKTDGTEINGELIGVKQDSTLILESSSRIGASIDISDIKVIKIAKGSKTVEGFVLGFLVGGAVGAAISATSYSGGGWGRGFDALGGGIVGGLAGGLLGGVTGISVHNYETFRIEGKSQEQIKAVLEKLRSKARFPEYQ